MGLTYIPYNPAADPAAHMAQGLSGLFSGLLQGIDMQKINQYQREMEIANQIGQRHGIDPAQYDLYPSMPKNFLSPQMNQMMAQNFMMANQPITPYQREALGIQNIQARTALEQAKGAGWEIKDVGNKLIAINPRTGLHYEVTEKGLTPVEQAQISKMQKETELLGVPTTLEQAQEAKLRKETGIIGKPRPLTQLEEAERQKTLKEIELLGKPKAMSKEERDNLRADTDLKMAQTRKANEEAGVAREMRNRSDANTLRGQFAQRSKSFFQIRDSYNRIQEVAKDPSPAGDISIIFSFMKILDPDSVVREGEYATAEKAGSVPDSIRNMYNKALRGERIEWTRDDFLNQAHNLYRAQEATQRQIINEFSAISRRWGINPQDVISDLPTYNNTTEETTYSPEDEKEYQRLIGIE